MTLEENPFLNDADEEDLFSRKDNDNPFVDSEDDDDEVALIRNKSRQKTDGGIAQALSSIPSPSSPQTVRPRKTLSGFKFPDDDTPSFNKSSQPDFTDYNDEEDESASPETPPHSDNANADASAGFSVSNDDDDDIFDDDDNPFEALSEDDVQQEDTDDGLDAFGGDPFSVDLDEDDDDSYSFNDMPETEDNEYANDTRLGQSVFSGFDIDKILETAIAEKDVSDVHVHTDQGVAFTRLGEIERRPEFGVPEGRVTRLVQRYLITHLQDQDFVREMDLDTSYVLKNGPYKGSRFRLNLALHFEEVALTFRLISDEIPTPESLGIEQELKDWFSLPAGLILINGPTGSGKSTTMASLMREIQLRRSKKIITVEKPIEYVYPDDGRGIVLQREVGKDTRGFGRGLSAAMRQAPHVILIGEVRDHSELSELLRAAETGHLAISTMHTNSVPTAINRIKSMFSGEEQTRVLLTLSDSVQGIMNQSLLKTTDGKGRFAVREILRVNAEIRNLIAEGDVHGIRAYQQRHKITMEHKLAEAVWQGRCTFEAGREQAVTPEDFDQYLLELQEEHGPGNVIREY